MALSLTRQEYANKQSLSISWSFQLLCGNHNSSSLAKPWSSPSKRYPVYQTSVPLVWHWKKYDIPVKYFLNTSMLPFYCTCNHLIKNADKSKTFKSLLTTSWSAIWYIELHVYQYYCFNSGLIICSVYFQLHSKIHCWTQLKFLCLVSFY